MQSNKGTAFVQTVADRTPVYGSRLNVFQYTRRIQELTKAGNMMSAIQVFASMKKEGVEPNVVTYNVMMDGYSRKGNPDAVDELFAEMLRTGIRPNLYVFNTALRACGIKANLYRAAHLLSSMQNDYGLRPDATSYGALIHVCAVAGQLPLAKACFARMLRDGIPRNDVIYNSLVDAYAEATDETKAHLYLKECKALVERMKREQIMPKDRTYCALMKLCVRGGLMQEALDVVPEMDGRDGHTTVIAFGLLLDGMIRIPSTSLEMKASILHWMLSEMERLRLTPDLIMYTMLLNICRRLNDLRLAEGFFRRLKEEGLKPNVFCYRAMISCYEVLGDQRNKESYLKSCFDLVEEMEITGVALNPEVCISLLSACGNVKEIDRALEVWDKALKLGITDDPRIFRAMIHACLKAKAVDRALTFLRQTEKRLVRDKSVHQMFIQHFIRRNTHSHVQNFLKEMKDRGINVHSSVQRF